MRRMEHPPYFVARSGNLAVKFVLPTNCPYNARAVHDREGSSGGDWSRPGFSVSAATLPRTGPTRCGSLVKKPRADLRKDILIQLINEAGQIVIAYKVHRCWPSEYGALPDLDANATDVAFEQLILQNEGWERDMSVAEPQEPSF